MGAIALRAPQSVLPSRKVGTPATSVEPVQLGFAHAYTPNESGSYGGGHHLVLDRPFVSGRLRRDKDDALCKPRIKFWGLLSEPDAYEICARCRELAGRHGLTLPLTKHELDEQAKKAETSDE